MSTVVYCLDPHTHLTASGTVDLSQLPYLTGKWPWLQSLTSPQNTRSWGQPWPKIGRCKNAKHFSLSLSPLFPISIWVNSEETHLLSHSWYALSYPLSSTWLLGSAKNSVATTLSVTFSLCPALGLSLPNKPSAYNYFLKTLCSITSLYIPKVATQFLTDTTVQQNTAAV